MIRSFPSININKLTNQIGAAFIAVLHPLARLLNDLLTAASRLPTPIKGIAAALAAAGLAATAVATTMAAFKAAMSLSFFAAIKTSLIGPDKLLFIKLILTTPSRSLPIIFSQHDFSPSNLRPKKPSSGEYLISGNTLLKVEINILLLSFLLMPHF